MKRSMLMAAAFLHYLLQRLDNQDKRTEHDNKKDHFTAHAAVWARLVNAAVYDALSRVFRVHQAGVFRSSAVVRGCGHSIARVGSALDIIGIFDGIPPAAPSRVTLSPW